MDEETFRRGIELFNRGEFFECHEVLEELWTPSRGPERLFLQALIHIAVGLYHHQRGNPVGAERQLRKGLHKIAGYLPRYGGIDTGAVREAVEQFLAGRGRERFPSILLEKSTSGHS
jgi:hypothetical protein